MPTRNTYWPEKMYKDVSKLSEDLNLPLTSTFQELVKQGLLFYKRQFNGILEEEAKTLTEEKKKE